MMMKHVLAVVLACGPVPGLLGQATNSLSPQIVERGADYRVWETYHIETNSKNQAIIRTNSYTELQTGMHFTDSTGNWAESKEIFDLQPGKAVASQGRHHVSIANDIHTCGSVTVQFPNGKVLRMHPLGLNYHDSSSGQSVLVSELKSCQGVLVAPNQILFADAFADIRGVDVRYTYTKAGIEQDVIFRPTSTLPTPTQLGLSDSARLEMMTEFLDGPAPVVETGGQGAGGRGQGSVGRSAVGGQGSEKVEIGDGDEVLDWAVMRMAQGKAFELRANSAPNGVKVKKHYLPNVEGRRIMVEQVPWKEVSTELSGLPKPQASLKTGQGRVGRVALGRAVLPRRPLAQVSNKRMEVAAMAPAQAGYVLDYILVLSDGDCGGVFKGDNTYFISGPVYLTNITVEGGSVLKFTRTGSGFLSGGGPVTWKTKGYRPSVFTSMDDNLMGEVISGSTGGPTNTAGIYWDNFDGELRNARFMYAGQAIRAGSASVWDCQFVHCSVGVGGQQLGVDLHNVLFTACNAGIAIDTYGSLVAENITADLGTNFVTFLSLSNGVDSVLKNCLFTRLNQNVTNALYAVAQQFGNSYTQEAVSQPSVIPYVVRGGGSYYLADNTFQNAGTTNIDPDLLADLRSKTTYPPMVYSNATITSALTLGQYVPRDTNALPALGYHYDPLDYAFGGTTANSNLTFTAGVAVGWFRTSSGWYHAGHGIHINDRMRVSFEGALEAPDYWVRANVVQESVNGLWAGGYGPGGITGWADQYAQDPTRSPEVNLRFTRCSIMPTDGGNHFRDDYGYLMVRGQDSEIWGGWITGYGLSFALTNCLLDRARIDKMEAWAGNQMIIRNCTWWGGWLSIDFGGGDIPVSVKDCAFDGTVVSSAYHPGNPALCDIDYNAFRQYQSQIDGLPVNHNQIVGNYDWQAGPLGNFYLPTNSPLIDTGSQFADEAGLYHFTITTNQAKEAVSRVDMGYHYPALDGSGKPIDSNGDGCPDYLADANGNGMVDPGETAWYEFQAPVICRDPQGQTNLMGASVRFSVMAVGRSPLYFQWLFNGKQITGATAPTLALGNIQTADMGYYSVLVSNALGRVLSQEARLAVIPPSVTNYWVDDSFPEGAVTASDNESWSWVDSWSVGADCDSISVSPNSGSLMHLSGDGPVSGFHQHYFTNATVQMTLSVGDELFADIYLDPFYPPREIMLQWYDANSGWEHRVYWGENLIDAGTDGTISRYHVGDLPATGGWVRLRVPANAAGLEGVTVSGMAFTLYDGDAAWDAAGSEGPGDANGNFIPDSWEWQYFGDLNQTADGDYDGDGISNLREYQLGTDPTVPDNRLLGRWRFDTSDWVGDQGQWPILATNVISVPSWSTNAVWINTNAPAILSYRDVELDGDPNIHCQSGTVRFWIKTDWNSGELTNAGRLMELGSQDDLNGWWALTFNTNGSQLAFNTKSNGLLMTNLTVDINFASHEWHQIVLTYTATGSWLYLDGQQATNGMGILYYPNAIGRSGGLRIGSDAAGNNQAGGVLDELDTYNYPLSAAAIQADYQAAISLDSDGDGMSNILENQLGLDPYSYTSPYGLTGNAPLQVFTPLK